MKATNETILQALWQVPLLILLASFIALAANHWREPSLPLVGDWSVAARLTDKDGLNLEISLEDAKQLFGRKAAKFLDARPQWQYEEGHISRALNLPWQDVSTAFTEIAPQLDEKDTIITYCDGESCELSHDLAMHLKGMGFVNVRVLVNGWTVWQNGGLSTEKTGVANEQ